MSTSVRLCQQDMSVVAPRPGICTSLGHPGGAPQPTRLSGGLLSLPMHPTRTCHPFPSSHLLSRGLCVLVHVGRNWRVPSVGTFDYGRHMQTYPGLVRIAQGVMLEITHSTMICCGKLMVTALSRWPFISISMLGGPGNVVSNFVGDHIVE